MFIINISLVYIKFNFFLRLIYLILYFKYLSLVLVLVLVFLVGESGSSELLLVLYISFNKSFDTFFAASYILLVYFELNHSTDEKLSLFNINKTYH